jgi:hypothetical protein
MFVGREQVCPGPGAGGSLVGVMEAEKFAVGAQFFVGLFPEGAALPQAACLRVSDDRG